MVCTIAVPRRAVRPGRRAAGAPRTTSSRGATTPRGVRVAIAASVVSTLWGVAVWLGSGPLAAPEPAPAGPVPVAAEVHLVEPGDTLWAIARSWQPHGDVRPLVDALATARRGRPLLVGEPVVRPAIPRG